MFWMDGGLLVINIEWGAWVWMEHMGIQIYLRGDYSHLFWNVLPGIHGNFILIRTNLQRPLENMRVYLFYT